MNSATASITVVVAVLTFRRPADLAEALPALSDQMQRLPDSWSVRLLVVDNDPGAGARSQVEDFASATPGVEVVYEHEAEPGIAAARNRALDVSGDRRLLIYIDDDERPSEDWLRLLLETWRSERPAAVVGPVVSTFATPPSPFVTAGRFFDRRRLATGTEVRVAATNNLLLDLETVRAHGLRFDTALGTVGGSDTLFTLRLVRAGGRMVWCDEAVVVDVVPADRTTTEWNLRRALRSGNSWSVASLRAEPRPSRRLRVRAGLIGRGVVRVGGGAVRVGWGVASADPGHRARGIRAIARGSGMLMGATGLLYREYARR